jgi:hypothetical protein
MDRRSVLAAAAALVPGGGCLSNESSLESGVLVVDNDQDASRTVTVEAARYTEQPGSETSGLRDRTWAGFYEAGSGIGGGMISVALQGNGQLTVGNPTIGA